MFHLLLNELAKVGACEICDYVKLCSQKSHYLATRALKQLICNYIATTIHGNMEN
jgi:hypothetical protein